MFPRLQCYRCLVWNFISPLMAEEVLPVVYLLIKLLGYIIASTAQLQ